MCCPRKRNSGFLCEDFGKRIYNAISDPKQQSLQKKHPILLQGFFRVRDSFESGVVSGLGLFRVRVCFGSGMMGQGCWAGTKGQWVWDHGTGIRNLWSRFLVSLAFSLHYSKTPLCLGNRNDISSPEVSHHVFPLLYR